MRGEIRVHPKLSLYHIHDRYASIPPVIVQIRSTPPEQASTANIDHDNDFPPLTTPNSNDANHTSLYSVSVPADDDRSTDGANAIAQSPLCESSLRSKLFLAVEPFCSDDLSICNA